ncbi:unnamed protein product [Rhizopus stolonifer]
MEAANYILESVLKDLSFLKDNHFLNPQTYQEVITLLPTHLSAVEEAVPRPPLPIRKSNSSTTHQLTPPQPREMNSGPKLPVRRTNDWSQQPIKLPSPVINPRQPEPEKISTPPPPAYAEHNTNQSVATAEALYDYRGEDPATDLSFKQGDIIEVVEYVNDDWWKGTIHGKTGIFPQNHVKKIPPPIKAKRPQPPSKPDHNTPSYISTPNMPYVYPPPPTTLYQPPPATQMYGQPPPVTQVYAQPPPPTQAYNQTQPVATQEEDKENKVSNITKKFGGQVATAATWGFGATLGSQAASAIF